ncbi:hypothetical protein E2C01_033719 [Portunus trituberculatus]|uniref:Uncharacterized protein n=1 Tax=Portunus trituberculatus TaxID=210409 RepID=A0A5B7F6E2_PORTR|nr:hypothetical protein [Portunus trituberculatus]
MFLFYKGRCDFYIGLENIQANPVALISQKDSPLIPPLNARFKVVTPKMRLGGNMGPNMGTTINKIACATSWRKLNSASQTLFKCAYRRYRS